MLFSEIIACCQNQKKHEDTQCAARRYIFEAFNLL